VRQHSIKTLDSKTPRFSTAEWRPGKKRVFPFNAGLTLNPLPKGYGRGFSFFNRALNPLIAPKGEAMAGSGAKEGVNRCF
jgi:hypothetical protein